MIKKVSKTFFALLALLTVISFVQVPQAEAGSKVLKPHTHSYYGPYKEVRNGYYTFIDKKGAINIRDRYACGQPDKCKYDAYLN